MAERPTYCHLVDVLRKFDPTLTESDITSDGLIGNDDRQQIRARIDSVCADLEDETGRAFRLQRVGSPGAPETYEYQDVEDVRPRTPLWAALHYRPVLPFESADGDALEIRTGKDTWEDITAEAGTEFTLDNRTGRLKIYRWLIPRVFWAAPDDRYLRATYRYGALGGRHADGGQTTLDGSVTNSATSVTVDNAARLPHRGIVLIGNAEYARITDVDYGTNTLTLDRGLRATAATAHGDGDVVHYCPENIRDAVAAKTARELVIYDDYTDWLVEGSEAFDRQAKLEEWKQEYERVLAKHADVRRM